MDNMFNGEADENFHDELEDGDAAHVVQEGAEELRERKRRELDFMVHKFLGGKYEMIDILRIKSYLEAHKETELKEDKLFRLISLQYVSSNVVQKLESIIEHLESAAIPPKKLRNMDEATKKKIEQDILTFRAKMNDLGVFVRCNFLGDRMLTSISAIMNPEPSHVKGKAKSGKIFKLIRSCQNFYQLTSLFRSKIQELAPMLDELASDLPAEIEAAAEAMDMWRSHEKNTDDYRSVLHTEEQDWLLTNQAENTAALSSMRMLIPSDIAQLSVAQLLELVRANGGLMSDELAAELQSNRLLHCIVTHADDIARSSFLVGASSKFFNDFRKLDLVELRAIAAALPEKFYNDANMSKTIWRSLLLQHTMLLAAQARGDPIKDGYCLDTEQRMMKRQPPLQPEQQRRSVYFHCTFEHLQSLRKKAMTLRGPTLASREAALAKAKEESAMLKEEVVRYFDEKMKCNSSGALSDPAVQSRFKEQYSSILRRKNQAPVKIRSAAENLKRTQSIIEATLTDSQFDARIRELASVLKEEANCDWQLPLQPRVPIRGVFPADPEIQQKQREPVAKFESTEKQAAQRKAELELLLKGPGAKTTEQQQQLPVGEDTGEAEAAEAAASTSSSFAANRAKLLASFARAAAGGARDEIKQREVVGPVTPVTTAFRSKLKKSIQIGLISRCPNSKHIGSIEPSKAALPLFVNAIAAATPNGDKENQGSVVPKSKAGKFAVAKKNAEAAAFAVAAPKSFLEKSRTGERRIIAHRWLLI